MSEAMSDKTNALEAAEDLAKGLSSRHIVIGPMVWQPSDGTTSKRRYFIIVRFTEEHGLNLMEMTVAERAEEASIARCQLIAALMRHPPLVVHDVEDEFDMAKLCETLWPCEQISRIRANIPRRSGIRTRHDGEIGRCKIFPGE